MDSVTAPLPSGATATRSPSSVLRDATLVDDGQTRPRSMRPPCIRRRVGSIGGSAIGLGDDRCRRRATTIARFARVGRRSRRRRRSSTCAAPVRRSPRRAGRRRGWCASTSPDVVDDRAARVTDHDEASRRPGSTWPVWTVPIVERVDVSRWCRSAASSSMTSPSTVTRMTEPPEIIAGTHRRRAGIGDRRAVVIEHGDAGLVADVLRGDDEVVADGERSPGEVRRLVAIEREQHALEVAGVGDQHVATRRCRHGGGDVVAGAGDRREALGVEHLAGRAVDEDGPVADGGRGQHRQRRARRHRRRRWSRRRVRTSGSIRPARSTIVAASADVTSIVDPTASASVGLVTPDANRACSSPVSSARMTCPERSSSSTIVFQSASARPGRRRRRRLRRSTIRRRPPRAAIAADHAADGDAPADQVVRLSSTGSSGVVAARVVATHHAGASPSSGGRSGDVIAVDRRPHYVPPGGVHLPSMPDADRRGVLRTVPGVSDRVARQVRLGRHASSSWPSTSRR